ncbi:MAG: glycerol-3-phosphate dehydrogenase/oxidase [Porticoccaceae bacterium]|jgi:glycerol-3-phosphate dehydrogenase|nr:glycerol-3-phosphate dehydrogenase/oxidase [Porticoccaceae bacterium]MDP4752802.1 glycerol-3-phosphate dehydrogenase/oxidase [Porticoccaceae bacterium]MDP4889930.1 glycerol-3-phosphate dehydrogenase/oxidase [Porticoccaceae bacterium]MDP4987026.1 glycerol-3-phosphate dehydrogenase/oxidase [Porticoccaceae bacterium]
MKRNETVNQLTSTHWDVLIVGGGVTGAAILHQATQQGIKAVLIEQRDFAWGTSSRSTKWVHGGIKYLTQGYVRLALKAVKERQHLLADAPGLVDNLELVVASYRRDWRSRWITRVGLFVYDIMGGKLRRHHSSARAVIARNPSLLSTDLSCGLTIYESVTDDARLVLRVLQEAQAMGARALNYCCADELIMENNQVKGVVATDAVSGKSLDIKAKLVVSATGAWADKLRQQVKSNSKKMRPLRGSHLVLAADRIDVQDNIVMLHPRDKRNVFIFKWEGRLVTGSTDLDHNGDLNEEPAVTTEEFDYLMENLNYHFPAAKLIEKDVIASFSGVRPVINSGAENPGNESRDHAIWYEKGLLTVTGGKLSTSRLIAQEVMIKTRELLNLGEYDSASATMFPQGVINQENSVLSPAAERRLLGRYGRLASELVEASHGGELETIAQTDTLWAEVRWAAGREQVEHLDDLMLRRTRLGLLLKNGGQDWLPQIGALCQPLLGWDQPRWNQEVDRYLSIWARYYSVPAAV